MFVFIRALTYSALFIGLFLIWVPERILSQTGMVRPAVLGGQQYAGMVIGSVGGIVALWCILTFASRGGGTPAPFDPPRQLVMGGPYRFVRNPMYIGAALALNGAALLYGSWALVGYSGAFLLVTHALILGFEEPALRRTFGQEYEAYCGRVKRWWPKV